MDDSDECSESEDEAGVDEPKIGEVMVSAETYHEVLRALQEETTARKRLEEKVALLSKCPDSEVLHDADNATSPFTVETTTPSTTKDWSPDSVLQFNMSDDEEEDAGVDMEKNGENNALAVKGSAGPPPAVGSRRPVPRLKMP